jgi:hypothetical protein
VMASASSSVGAVGLLSPEEVSVGEDTTGVHPTASTDGLGG